jgi:hypothetical protein
MASCPSGEFNTTGPGGVCPFAEVIKSAARVPIQRVSFIFVVFIVSD